MFVVAVLLWVIPFSELRADWPGGLVIVGLLFAFLEAVVVVIVAVIASKRRTATTTPPTDWKGAGQGILWLFSIGILYAAGGYAAEWVFPESGWATKWRYSLETDLRDAEYVMEKHPHDCEFMSAPLGNKHCHYDKEVATVRIRVVQSRREVSYDEGKTWTRAERGVRPTVLVTWSKVQE